LVHCRPRPVGWHRPVPGCPSSPSALQADAPALTGGRPAPSGASILRASRLLARPGKVSPAPLSRGCL